ncbi:hypothetical protein [Actinopolymorpha rutila]|uniref:Uncharacterized protein n=1 Tax=Actinopolymorpha rutila TaxID=446787 RepID=A0A852ZS62_9ACTN|nr:hypothetical protein [Actinopolymorpha rutila]NYH91456.1 hypothetical protein [Actinopolymorpha rutila]
MLGGIGFAAGFAAAPVRPAVAARAALVSGAEVVVRNDSVGRGMSLVGYNTGHYLPGSNTSAWVAYSRINAARFFASFTEWAPDEAFDDGSGIATVGDFDARRAELRTDPEGNAFIRWDLLEDLFEHHTYANTNHYRLNYQVGELRRLGVTPILEAAELAWNRPWSGLWLQWQKHYAFSYHLARHFDVERYNFVNEPDHPSAAGDLVDQAVYVRGLQIASDAIRSAIADVNDRYGKRLRATVQAPVITHASSSSGDDHMDADHDADHRDDTTGWGEVSLRNLRTDYHGEQVDQDLFDVFDTHQYNKQAPTYEYEIDMMRAKMAAYTPTGVALPIVYSEFNRRNTGAFETSGDDVETPAILTDLARIWAAGCAGGVEGMIAFKFQNTVRSNGIPYGTGFYYVADEGAYDIRGATKAAEVNRMFARGFAGDKELLTVTADDGRTVLAAHDPAGGRTYLWLPHPPGVPTAPVTLDLRDLPEARPGGEVLVEEVGPAYSGGVVERLGLPPSGRLTLRQPADSVWLVSLSAPGPRVSVFADVDASVRRDGDPAESEAELEAELGVCLVPDGTPGAQVSYLEFDLRGARPGGRTPRHALLELFGSTDDGRPLTFMAYALSDTSWSGEDLTWATAPHLDPVHCRPSDVGTAVFPAGQLTAPGTPGSVRLEVSDSLRYAVDGRLGFLLIRDRRRAEDVADDGRRAVLSGRRSADRTARPRLVLSD